jgi:hypothetical protein
MKNVKVEYLVDICGTHDAPIDTLTDEKQSKEFSDPYKAIDFLNSCTYCTNITEVLKSIECEFSLDLENELLLNKEEFVKFTDNLNYEL